MLAMLRVTKCFTVGLTWELEVLAIFMVGGGGGGGGGLQNVSDI